MKICYLFRPRYLVSPYINAVCRLVGSVYYQPNRLPYGPARSIHERHKTWPENNYLAASHVISVIFNKIFTQVCNEAVRRMHMHEADVNRSVQGWHGYESLFVTPIWPEPIKNNSTNHDPTRPDPSKLEIETRMALGGANTSAKAEQFPLV